MKKGIYRNCQKCGIEFYIQPSQINYRPHIYCSFKCRGGAPSNLRHGKGKLSPSWKGDKAGYFALHEWVRSNYKTADHCEYDPSHQGRFEWANISGSYLRDINDWVQLCAKCHRQYDRIRRGRYEGGQISL